MGKNKAEGGVKTNDRRLVATILVIVAIALALLAIDYVYWRVTHEEIPPGPTATLTLSTVDYGYKFTFDATSTLLEWSDTLVYVDDGEYLTGFWVSSEDLTSVSPPVSMMVEEKSLYYVWVYCNFTDLKGNGLVDNDDFFTLTAGFLSWEGPFLERAYNVTVKYSPTYGEICHASFIG